MSTQITVTGHAEIRIAPELGAVTLVVGGSGANRDGVLQQTGGTHEELIADIRALEASGAIASWSANQLRVWSHRPWNAEGRQLPLVHEARGELELVFRDLALLSEWVAAAAVREHVTVTGIEWRVTDATGRRVRDDAQRRAVDDAVAKAVVYAEALGLGHPAPVELADHGLLSTRSQSPAPQPMMMRAAAFDANAQAAPELAPADLVIETSVDARFTADPA